MPTPHGHPSISAVPDKYPHPTDKSFMKKVDTITGKTCTTFCHRRFQKPIFSLLPLTSRLLHMLWADAFEPLGTVFPSFLQHPPPPLAAPCLFPPPASLAIFTHTAPLPQLCTLLFIVKTHTGESPSSLKKNNKHNMLTKWEK